MQYVIWYSRLYKRNQRKSVCPWSQWERTIFCGSHRCPRSNNTWIEANKRTKEKKRKKFQSDKAATPAGGMLSWLYYRMVCCQSVFIQICQFYVSVGMLHNYKKWWLPKVCTKIIGIYTVSNWEKILFTIILQLVVTFRQCLFVPFIVTKILL